MTRSNFQNARPSAAFFVSGPASGGIPRPPSHNSAFRIPHSAFSPMRISRESVIVAGGGGFIGGHLVARMKESGYKKIRSVDRKPLEEWYQVHDGVENVVADLSRLEPARAACKDMQHVYMLAADMGGMGFIENNKALCMLSVLTSTHMLEAAKDAGVDRFFYSSSACVYNADKQRDANVVPLKEADAYPA